MPPLRQELERAFLQTLPQCAEMLAIAQRMLEEERPDAVMASYETGPFQRALLIQAGRSGIPTVGLMHGMIFANHYDYMHCCIIDDPAAAGTAGFVAPRVTCVWGPTWKQVLTEHGHYPPGAVAVTGHWRYDDVVAIASGVNIEETKRRVGVSAEKLTVLVTSNGVNTIDYLQECLTCLAGRPDCQPIVRLHPSDDVPAVQDALQSLGYPSSVLVGGNLMESLAIAKLVISQKSTVATEALLLDKPLIVVDFQDLPGWEVFADSGICLYVGGPEELQPAINLGLDDPSIWSQLKEAREEFLRQYFFKIDGQAAQRVVSVVDDLVSATASTSVDTRRVETSV
jgi:hypothetical protein